MIKIDQIPTSASLSNTYLIQYKGLAYLIDPGGEFGRIQQALEEIEVKPDAILLTHGHVDHIGAVDQVREAYGAKIYAHKAEAELLKTPELNLSVFFGDPMSIYPDVFLTEGPIGDYPDVKVIHTPGHTAGGVCYEIAGVLFTGDTLFQGSIGRTDLPTADHKALVPSILEKIMIYSNATVYPGHGPKTTTAVERHTNPFLRGF